MATRFRISRVSLPIYSIFIEDKNETIHPSLHGLQRDDWELQWHGREVVVGPEAWWTPESVVGASGNSGVLTRVVRG